MNPCLCADEEKDVVARVDATHAIGRFQKMMFWSLAAAIIGVPVFLVFGKSILDGPRGWNAMFLMYTVAPVYIIYHIVLFWMAWRINHRKEYHRNDYHLPKRTSQVLVVYYLFHVMFQLFFDDGGDQGATGSIMEKRFGVPSRICSDLAAFFFYFSFGLAFLLAILIGCADHSMSSRDFNMEEQLMCQRDENGSFQELV